MPAQVINNYNYDFVNQAYKDTNLDISKIYDTIKGQPAEYVLSSLDAERLARYETLKFIDIPNNPKGWSDTSPFWKFEYNAIKAERDKWTDKFKSPLTPDDVWIKYNEPKEIHTDYDIIKTERDNWINIFPNDTFRDKGITPANIRVKYDAKEKTLTKEEQDKLTGFDTIKDDLDKWTNLFPLPLTPEQVKVKFDEPKGKTLTAEETTAIKEYPKWIDKFGTKTPDDVWKKYDEPKGAGITKEQQDKIDNFDTVKAERDLWTTAFPNTNAKFKKSPQGIRSDYDNLETRLSTAIANLATEQGKNKKLQEDNDRLRGQVGTPAENIIEQELRQVIISEDWNYSYLVKSLENFLTWRDSQSKERRLAVYKYWNTIKKNIDWLRERLNGALLEY